MMRLARRRIILLATVVVATAIVYAAATQRPRSAAVLHDGEILELALELDAAATRSLRRAPETDVPGKLAVGGRTPESMDVRVRIKGQLGSRRSIDDKPALKISTTAGARAYGYENLTLNNMVQDPTMLHEAIGYQVYADAGVAVPETAYVRLAINGQPRGLYLLVETIDRQFLARRFGDDSGILYEGAYGTDLRASAASRFELDEGEDPNREELTRLIRAVAATGDDVFYGPDALVDTPSFVSMMAVQVMIGDWDNYYRSNNYRIYWQPSARRWFFIPTGIDQTFATRMPVTPFGGKGVLFVKCLRSERCRADYVAALRKAAARLEQLNLPQKIEHLRSTIDAAAHADRKKPYTAAQMDAARLSMLRFIEARPDIVRAAILDARSPGR